ncbi:MAG TPA: hypothetical protein VLM85_21945, partial [Polyangiaceae bacterium]|nr:hypothetical protein [Polyangiaceae bacterium]
ETCAEDKPCVDVAPGHPFVPVPWSGFDCSAQCNKSCRENSFEGPGTFRLVVHACDDDAIAAGPAFELPEVLRAHDLERWGLASDVAKVTIARLEFPAKGGFDAAAPAAPDHIAGFVVRAGSERVLEQASADALLALVRDHKGFDDQTVDRCAVRHLVGFRLERTPPTTGAAHSETAEIALDFTCDKLFAAHRGGALPRKAIGVRFSPSRAGFLALVKRALPGDPELAGLK